MVPPSHILDKNCTWGSKMFFKCDFSLNVTKMFGVLDLAATSTIVQFDDPLTYENSKSPYAFIYCKRKIAPPFGWGLPV